MAKQIVTYGISRAGSALLRPDGVAAPAVHGLLSRALSVQRPVVLAYLRALRRRNPEADPTAIAKLAADHYLWAVTGGGAAVGATAVIPGIGTVAGLGIAAAETGGFLEMTALYAQSMAELSGVRIDDEGRANALVMGIILGSSGQKLVREFAQKASGKEVASGGSAANRAAQVVAEGKNSGWGSLVATQVPQSLVGPLTKKLKHMLLKRYATGTVGSVIGRVLPFGVGAAVGGVVNHSMARSIVNNTRIAFGAMPAGFGEDLDVRSHSARGDADLLGGLRRALRWRQDRAAGTGREGDGADGAPTSAGRARPPANVAQTDEAVAGEVADDAVGADGSGEDGSGTTVADGAKPSRPRTYRSGKRRRGPFRPDMRL